MMEERPVTRGAFGLRAWRDAEGMTQEALATLIRSRYRGSGATRQLIQQWESGEIAWPTPHYRRVLADLTGRSIQELGFHRPGSSPPTVRGDDRLTEAGESYVSKACTRAAVSRPLPVATTPTEEIFAMAAEDSAAFAAWAAASNITALTLEQLQDDIQQLVHSYPQEPVFALLRRARMLQTRVFELLYGRQPPRLTGQLYALAAHICALLTWLAIDAGQHGAARTEARTAWLCAQLSDDAPAQARVAATRATLAYWTGDPLAAAAITQQAATHTRSPSTSLTVLLECQTASNLASAGRAEAATQALQHADQARQDLGAELGEGEHDALFYGFGAARQYGFTASTWLRLGHPRQALEAADAALNSLPASLYGSRALVRCDQAAAHLSRGDLDGVIAALSNVLTLLPEHRLTPVATRIGQLASALAASPLGTCSLATELYEQITDYRRHAITD